LESGVDLPFNLIGLTTNALLAGLTIFFYTGTTFLMGCVFFWTKLFFLARGLAGLGWIILLEATRFAFDTFETTLTFLTGCAAVAALTVTFFP